jgi:hypothetical protein
VTNDRTLLFYELEDEAIQRQLWDALLESTRPERETVYLAHMMLRQVEWSARNDGASAVPRFSVEAHSFPSTETSLDSGITEKGSC